MLLLKIDKTNKMPVYQQVFNEIKQRIESGILKSGEKLPASRLLAENLGVNRSTIYRAYEELWSFGYIESRPGSYSIVRERAKLAENMNVLGESEFDWSQVANPLILDELSRKDRYNHPECGENIINFLPLSPDYNLMPVEYFRKCVNNVLVKDGARFLGYNNSIGYEPLREFICHRLGHHSIRAGIDNVMVSNGTHNALELILKYLVKPGDKIIVEAPTYSVAIPLFQLYQADVLEVSLTNDGLDLQHLEKALKKHKVAFVFTMANFQNPTGVTTSQQHREKLLAICKKCNTPIVEDGFEEEMKYFGKSVLPIKSMDETGLVIYLGTFSKTLFPGLRLGWIVANEKLIAALARLKKICDISGNFLSQAAVYEFCQSGNYELHVKRLHRVYRKRMVTALKIAEKHLPKDKCWFTKPLGGYSFWISLNENIIDEAELIDRLFKNGVAVTPGNLFFVKEKSNPSFRLSIAHLSENQIEEGVKIIANVIKSIN
jgi:DNA-binding transcriptional MocR family regulator